MKDTPSQKPLSPSVHYLYSILKQRIDSGEYPHGRWLPSERSLAEEFSVCRPTVRQAIVELDNNKLIQRTAGHRPVVWNRSASPLGRGAEPQGVTIVGNASSEGQVNGKTSVESRNPEGRMATSGSVGLWVSGTPRDMGAVALTNGVHQGLAQQESPPRLVMACPQGVSHAEMIRSEAAALMRMAEDKDIVGVILWYLGGEESLPALEQLRATGKSIVFVDREPPEGFEADFVGVHNTFASAEAVRYLIDCGHQHILHLTNLDRASTVQERLEGYLSAIREAGIPYRPEFVISVPFRHEREEDAYWQGLVQSFRDLPDWPTAAFTVNDYTAYCLIRSLRAAGFRVPEDMAVVGFDNTERWSSLDPFMSSVSQPFEQIGIEAARLLMMRYEYPQMQTYRHLLLPAPLVVRGSSDIRR